MIGVMTWSIRAVGPDDRDFLAAMLFEAANWRGDTGLIAIDDRGNSIGAAWFRLIQKDEPGFGFINENTPEISVAVVEEYRARGVGTALMSALISEAQQQGFRTLSLSVETDNPALELYERVGFQTVRNEDGAVTMRLDL